MLAGCSGDYSCIDIDGDGYYSECTNGADAREAEAQGTLGDCNDDDPTVHQSSPEICNDLDDDCDGTVDENVCQPVGDDDDSTVPGDDDTVGDDDDATVPEDVYEDEPNDTFSEAMTLTCNTSMVYGSIQDQIDVDYFRYDLDQPSIVGVWDFQSDQDLQASIYDGDGEPLLFNDPIYSGVAYVTVDLVDGPAGFIPEESGDYQIGLTCEATDK